MRLLSKSGSLQVVKRGDYWYAEGVQQATNKDRSAIVREIRALLQAISPEALELAEAYAAIDKIRTPEMLMAQESLRRKAAE